MITRALIAALLSGTAALVCEIAWARPLTLIVGDTTFAVALILSVFFAGMAVGSALIGRRAPQAKSPLRMCAWIQLIIGVSAALSMPLLSMVIPIHAETVRSLGRWSDLPVGVTLVSLALLVPTVLMGGTTPLLIQGLSRISPAPETTLAARVYAWNTLGGAAGAVLAGLLFIPMLGLMHTCFLAGLLSIGSMALLFSLKEGEVAEDQQVVTPSSQPTPPFTAVAAIAVISGFVALGSEVLWARMLSSTITNSSASFALVVACVLFGLTLGAWIVARLDFATRWVPLVVMQFLISVALVLSAFFHGKLMLMAVAVRSWFELSDVMGGLVTEVILSLLLVLIPAVLMGINLPLVFAAWPGKPHTAGRRWGNLIALNTVAAIGGSVLAATLLIPLLEVRGSMAMLAGLSAVGGIALWQVCSPRRRVLRVATLAALGGVIATLFIMPANAPLAPSHTLLSRSDGVGATVSVTESPTGARVMLINDRYIVGSTAGRIMELRQAVIPTLLHPRPERIFHLGMGTGHTAGALATSPGLDRLVTCDNLPGVIDAAEEWFSDTNLNLFDDPKSEIIHADGRHWLSTTDEQFDLIVIDNLLPWLSGAGHLHSREFYELLRDHLAPDGIACIWLPAHQIDQRLLALVSDTLSEVFPSVHLWVTQPLPESSIGLIASSDPIDLAHLLGDQRFRTPQWHTALTGARIGEAADIFAGLSGLTSKSDGERPINTDNFPIFEQWAFENFQENLVPHSEVYASPAAASVWSALLAARRHSAAELRGGLGLNGELSEPQLEIATRIWNRWLNLTDLVAGLSALTLGDDTVESLCLQALNRDPEDPNAQDKCEWLLGVLNRGGAWRAAAELGESADALFAMSDEAKIQWASSLLDSGRHFRARRVLEGVFESDPDNVEAGVSLIRALQVQTRPEDAHEVLEVLLERHPDHPWIQAIRAEMPDDEHAEH